MQKQDSAFDWLKDELSGFAGKGSFTVVNGSSSTSHGSSAPSMTAKAANAKYDSSISIPRPNRRNTTEIVRPVAGTTPTVAWSNFNGAGQKHPIVQLPMTSKPSTSSLPGTGAMNGVARSVVAPSSPRIPPRSPPSVAPAPSTGVHPASPRVAQSTLPTTFHFPSTAASTVRAPVQTSTAVASKTHEPDPFEISETVKTLAARMRSSELPQNSALTSGQLAPRITATPTILPAATTTPVVANVQPSSIVRPYQVLPQTQETLRPQAPNTVDALYDRSSSVLGRFHHRYRCTCCNRSFRQRDCSPYNTGTCSFNRSSSFRSHLSSFGCTICDYYDAGRHRPSATKRSISDALSALFYVASSGAFRAALGALNSSSSTGSGSTFGTWSSTSSADLASDLSHYFQPPRQAEPTPMPATNWGHLGWQVPVAHPTPYAPTPYAPTWSLNSHHFVEQRAPTALVYNVQGAQLPAPSPTSKYSSIRYGLDGIPIIEPIPVMQATPTPYAPTNGTMNGRSSAAAPVIDLNDLDPNKLIEKVRAKADFASVEQCRAALRRHDFDVDRTVRELKIEKLLETGLAADRDLAASALDSCQWSVNDAANRLIS
ncbi:Protein kinase domain containing protein [Aphelenchoides avenae]|nr:Protein kinase domain containing protein [Aphelenchus avenae]